MKRIFLVVALSLFFFIFSQAQFRVAIVGGGHQSKILEDNNLPGWDSLKKRYSGRNGVHFGFIADLRLSESSNFYFQPGVIFFTKGRNYKTSPTDSTVILKTIVKPHVDSIVNTVYFETRKQFINYIDIPLNIVYKLRLGKKASFIIGGGPYLSLFYDGSDKREHILVDVKYTIDENNDLPVGKGQGKYSILNYGINGLAGFEFFDRIFLTANYSRGLKDFYKPADYTATNYKHEVMGATLGIFFGKQVQPVPKDNDGDGTPDKSDKCPDIAGPVKLLGCPDTDNDGITDPEDKCPGEAGAIDNLGCPDTDKDRDAILDKNDKCPEIPGLSRYQGCPVPDKDGDAVNDEEDKCPDIKGIKEKNGCPEEIEKEIVQKVEYAAKRIRFKVNSAELLAESFKVLDDVAAILKSNPEIRVSIEGHTSSEGAYTANMKLSENRANKVKSYLESKGIDAARLSAIGFGPDKPLNEGKTAIEKAQNRRVELKLSKQ